jgi:tetratricopeptide (TPR) repeat protein
MRLRPRTALAALLAAAPLAAQQPAPPAAADSVPLFADLGTLHHAVTATPAAQRYFDQGLRLMYGFNHEEAINSFRQALRLDPQCAMCHWGIALALGPNINAPMDPSLERQAAGEAAAAASLAGRATEAERAYVAAVGRRYSATAGANRAPLDSAYAAAMRALAARYPGDPDAAALFAESMLDLSPWDNWTPEGAPKPGTEEIVATLERALAAHPDHPGVCHFYIHTVEASLRPERAVPCAERLPSLMPGAGHLVHMPAHVYMRVGRYADATMANEHAAHTDQAYLADRQPKGMYPFYLFHNLDFLRAAAMMEGRSAEALETSAAMVGQIPPEVARQVSNAELALPSHALALARFGRWREVLAEPAPAADLRYAVGMWHYARGVALAGSGRFAEAAVELDSVRAIGAAVPAEKMMGFHPARSLLGVAHHALAGEIALRQGRAAEAVQHLEVAVRMEDGLRYDEPEPWYYPVRQSLGAALLAAGRPADAERVYRDDLRRHPHNGWSLYGLAEALRAQGKDDADARRQFQAAWSRADVTLASSRF